MRLRKLIVQGFKSFADRTEFVFDAPITGIVGPNGCGKSNVVDAFKWVLGEQSAKSLRGDAMMDVIFNGSGNRKPSGMAEVILVFENPPRGDGSRALAFEADEVAVGRRLFRDGTSEYQVNDRSSRLRDIREMFLDTGVGVDAYSVIEQGRVAALLEANPEERRVIFEEAAGISKFKQKKREAERKLEKVDQNLLRVNDIFEEVEKRLRSVKVQAGRARTFQEHSTRLRELRLSYALQEYHVLHGWVAEVGSKVEDERFRLDDAATDLRRDETELSEKRDAMTAMGDRRQASEYELVQARASMQSARQRQAYAGQQLEQIAEQLSGFDADKASAEAKLAALESSLAAESATLERLTGELEDGKRAIESRQQAFSEGQLRSNRLARQIEQHKTAILDVMRRSAQVNTRLGAIEIERRNITQQETRLVDRRKVVTSERQSTEGQATELKSRLDEALAAIADRQSKLEAKRVEARALGTKIAELSDRLGKAKEHRSGLQSRKKLLGDLEARREGVSEGVKAVLRQREGRFSFIRGLVADLLRVDVEHAHVIEAALDGRDQWLVADASAAAIDNREAFEELEGRVNVICLDRADGDDAPVGWDRHAPRIRLAADLVRGDESQLVRRLLGRTAVVETLDDAAALLADGPAGWRYVTRAGEVLETDGTLRAGPLSAAMGLLSRRSELDAVTQQLAEVESRIERFTAQVSEGNAQSKALADDENALRNEVYQANTVKVEITGQAARTQDKLNALGRELPVLERELEQLRLQVGRLEVEQTQLNAKRADLETEQETNQSQVTELSAALEQLNAELRGHNEALTAARVALGQVQEKQLASRQQVQRQTANRQESVQQIERMIRGAESLIAKRLRGTEELATAQREERELVGKVAALDEATKKIGTELEAAKSAVTDLAARVEILRSTHGQIESTLHEAELRLGESRVRLEGLVQRTRDELELDLPERYAGLFGESEDGAPATGYEPGAMDWEVVAAEIKDLRERIGRLGNVNLDAINEQDELESRRAFLSAQVEDLRQSKRQLEELIAAINAESGLRFEQTFNAVREHFQTLFRKLFGGGKADIFLQTEVEDRKAQPTVGPDGQMIPAPKRHVDILEAGIEIVARPPGKQPVNISQLSGGEKTMTCVAMLMSIFKSKPSPFCILDEVDAALDEANNQRFNLIVQEFLDQSQFIIITHSKRTMQIADVLYGVTMQEQGVSKRVAVKFDQVDSQGRIEETAAA